MIKLARPYLEKTNLDIKIHTKVALVILIIRVTDLFSFQFDVVLIVCRVFLLLLMFVSDKNCHQTCIFHNCCFLDC